MNQTFINWLITESDSRYSVEVNFRTKIDEVLDSYAKICLGYVSAALKKYDFHVKHVFEDKPRRILVSMRCWDDGEWVAVVSWNPERKKFILSAGFWNKDRKTVSIMKGEDKAIDSDNASTITQEVRNLMHKLKDEPDRHVQKLKGVPLKRGPKK